MNCFTIEKKQNMFLGHKPTQVRIKMPKQRNLVYSHFAICFQQNTNDNKRRYTTENAIYEVSSSYIWDL